LCEGDAGLALKDDILPAIKEIKTKLSPAIESVNKAANAAAKAMPGVADAATSVASTFATYTPYGIGIMAIGALNSVVQTGTFIVRKLTSFSVL
jgi:hypothetical protein